MRELFGLMNLLDNEKYADEDDFFERFGGDKEAITLPQVQALQVSPAGHSPPNPPQPPYLMPLCPNFRSTGTLGWSLSFK